MLLVLPRRGDTFLLPFGHPVRANFRVQVDIDFILIKHGMFCRSLIQRLSDGKLFFFIQRVPDFQRWRGSAPDNARTFQVSVQSGAMQCQVKNLVDDAGQQLCTPA